MQLSKSSESFKKIGGGKLEKIWLELLKQKYSGLKVALTLLVAR